MKSLNRLMLIACLALPFAACKKEEAVVVEKPPVAVPTTDEKGPWQDYLNDLIPRHMDGITGGQYIYRVPATDRPEDPQEYARLLEQAELAVQRGIIKGNLIAYVGLDPTRTADFAVAALEGVGENTMNGVRLIYVGDAANSERVRVAAAPAGVDYVFVDMK